MWLKLRLGRYGVTMWYISLSLASYRRNGKIDQISNTTFIKVFTDISLFDEKPELIFLVGGLNLPGKSFCAAQYINKTIRKSEKDIFCETLQFNWNRTGSHEPRDKNKKMIHLVR